MLLAKNKLSTIKMLISKALIESYINHDELVLVNNVVRSYNEMRKGIENPQNFVECTI